MIRIVLQKGRLYARSLSFFASLGIDLAMKDREFIATDRTAGLQAILVKNQDLPRYVYNGAATLGICGSDSINEYNYNFYRLLTLPFGSARLCVAVPQKKYPLTYRSIGMRVATKYIEISKQYFHSLGITPTIIPLHGSVEIAPTLGLADCIVDIVETGSTLNANNLVIQDEIQKTEVQLIANMAQYKILFREIDALVARMKEHLTNDTN